MSIDKEKEEQQRKAKRKRARGFINDLGKLLVDVSKLTFGGLVIGTVIKWDIPHETTFIVGVIIFILIAIIGLLLERVE